MLEPRILSPESLPAALKQAQHYRLLNEPAQAESICRDILAVDEGNDTAWVTLLLALTDQFGERRSLAFDQANEVLARLSSEFQRHYYHGIIHERWARAQLKAGVPRESIDLWISRAMSSYTQAAELAPANDPNPWLRWNTCARFLNESEGNRPVQSPSPTPVRDVQDEFGDDVPLR